MENGQAEARRVYLHRVAVAICRRRSRGRRHTTRPPGRTLTHDRAVNVPGQPERSDSRGADRRPRRARVPRRRPAGAGSPPRHRTYLDGHGSATLPFPRRSLGDHEQLLDRITSIRRYELSRAEPHRRIDVAPAKATRAASRTGSARPDQGWRSSKARRGSHAFAVAARGEPHRRLPAAFIPNNPTRASPASFVYWDYSPDRSPAGRRDELGLLFFRQSDRLKIRAEGGRRTLPSPSIPSRLQPHRRELEALLSTPVVHHFARVG